MFTGYTDTAVIAGQLNNHNCLSYGPGNLELAHKPDEYVDLADIARCYQVLLKLAEQNLTA
ncbi:M20/M25/M40 family metallo-hydrolase [Loigolactobacillus coryniformis]|uniref:M20/M25/M40 family metallo-hydrolase n=1 Tax=Loigolactobacillus coryniformis TaxID=1610 RepID=UPI00030EEB9D